MAKHKKKSKVQKRGKLRRGKSATRSKARRVSKVAKRTVASPKLKRARVKKAARKVKQSVNPPVETVIVEIIEQSAPGVINGTEVEETPGSGLRRALKRMNPNRKSSQGSTPGN